MRRMTLRREALTELELRVVVAARETPTLPLPYCFTDLDRCHFTTGLTEIVQTVS